jgi:hypothetical protein
LGSKDEAIAPWRQMKFKSGCQGETAAWTDFIETSEEGEVKNLAPSKAYY